MKSGPIVGAAAPNRTYRRIYTNGIVNPPEKSTAPRPTSAKAPSTTYATFRTHPIERPAAAVRSRTTAVCSAASISYIHRANQSQPPCDHGPMARRTGSNARGDLNELSCAISMIEHGFAVNALTATDTGWDLHCHIPEDLILSASAAGRNSWQLSGKTAHIQVKSAATDILSIGTVRGWLTGTASGVPTLMFGHYRGRQVFSTPNDLEAWLASADRKIDSDDVKHKYTYAGKATEKQTPLSFHQYVEERFPSVIQLWTEYPQIALDFPDLTTWMNHEDRDPGWRKPTAIVEGAGTYQGQSNYAQDVNPLYDFVADQFNEYPEHRTNASERKGWTHHGLRHWAVSSRIHAGVPFPLIAAEMGHADSAFTLARYGHVLHESIGVEGFEF